MSFSMGSSYLLHSHFPSFASSSSQSVSFHVKNSNNNAMTERKRVVSACMGQENPKDIVFSKKRAILFLGISILPFLQLRARALEGLVTISSNQSPQSLFPARVPEMKRLHSLMLCGCLLPSVCFVHHQTERRNLGGEERRKWIETRGTEKEATLKAPEEDQKEELAIQRYTPPNPFLFLLNGLGIFGTGVLGALYALAQKEKNATDKTVESDTFGHAKGENALYFLLSINTCTGWAQMIFKLKEKEATIEFLEKNFESKLSNEQKERMKQLKKAKEEQQFLSSQLNSANSIITGLGKELKNEKRIIEELEVQVEGLENNLSKAGEDKKALEQLLKEKLGMIEALQDKISLLSSEIKDKEYNAQNLSSSLADMELELKNLNHTLTQTNGELAKACSEIKGLKGELLKNEKELEMRNSVVDELNSKISSLIVERDEYSRQLNTIQEEYNDLKSSSENKAALDATLLRERESELHLLKEKLEVVLNEASGNQARIEDLTRERKDLRRILDDEVSNAKTLKDELHITQEALEKLRKEASDLSEQLEHSQNQRTDLQAEVSRIQAEFAEATETLQKSVEKAKQSGELLASELTATKEKLRKTKEELQIMSQDLAMVAENRDSFQKEMVDAYKKAEVAANGLEAEKNIVSSLNKEMQNLEKQMLKDKESRKSLETDLEDATKSLDEMNRNALILSGELEMANSRISSLEDEKQVLYKSLTEQKNAAKEAQENMEDAHSIVVRLGRERESLDKKGKKLDEELASAKGEILRLRSKINSSNIAVIEQKRQKTEPEDLRSNTVVDEEKPEGTDAKEKVTVNAKRSGRTRRRRASSP
ncbi:hypothetical protein DKX38_001433 [Salix brachista]|uniref:MAR-binding filament-like protein 1-1 n=1 Tax=Salix brachista TaxID=2182728 RepID=A0A5N5P419_9ROSI|nr:hypothetical protein DKX38_001433 [Salix brachista]